MTYLKLGQVDLVTSGPGTFLIEGLSSDSGTEWGSPRPIEVTLANLRLGPLVVQDGFEARETTVAVRIRGVDSAALATAEAALWREIGKPNTLTWQPVDGKGAASVFEVMTSSMVGRLDDLRETASLERAYVLRLVCRPFVRSVDKTIIPALLAGGSPTTVVVADGTTTTGWTGNGTVTAAGGFVTVSPGPGPGPELTYTASLDLTATRYLTIRVRREKPGTFKFIEFYVNGGFVPIVASSPRTQDAGYFYRTYTIDAGPQTVSSVRIDCFGTGLEDLSVDYIERTNLPPGSGTGRQLVRTIDVPGSAPTEGSLQITHDTSALGTLLAYTWRDDVDSGWTPPLMPWLTSGGATPDAARVSGQTVNVTGATVFEVPAAMPDGSFVLLALMKSDTPQDVRFEYQLRTKIGANYVGPTIAGEVPVSFNSTAWVVKSPTGLLHLPTLPLGPETNATLEVTIQCVMGIDLVTLDEAWLFNTDIGQLSWLAVGSGAPAAGGDANRVWINSRTLERPRPEYLVGTAADGTDAYGALANAQLMFPTEHVWDPGTVNVLTVTTNALYAEAAFDCYSRAPFHVAP